MKIIYNQVLNTETNVVHHTVEPMEFTLNDRIFRFSETTIEGHTGTVNLGVELVRFSCENDIVFEVEQTCHLGEKVSCRDYVIKNGNEFDADDLEDAEED